MEAGSVNPDYFKRLFCDMFLSHVRDPYNYSEEDDMRKACIGVTYIVCAKLWGLLLITVSPHY